MRILLLDVETAPCKFYIWGLWQEIKSTSLMISDWHILVWCAKWLDGKQVYHGAINESKTYKKNPECDKEIMNKLKDLLSEADVVIAHNAVKFDNKRIKTRFICNRIDPPPPYKTIDTLKVARRNFAFLSNRLNDLGQFLGVGKKIATDFNLWKGCLDGDKDSFKKMVKYCKQDVILLEKVYLKIRPYILNHPNYGVYVATERPLCPSCGSGKIQYRGYARTHTGCYKRFQCIDCRSWGRERYNEMSKDKMKSLTRGVS